MVSMNEIKLDFKVMAIEPKEHVPCVPVMH